MNAVKGFSKDDLIKRRDSLLEEWNNLRQELGKMLDEVEYINKLIRDFEI